MTCPWQSMRDPFVIAVVNAHARLKKNATLTDQFPNGVPYALYVGLWDFERALDAVTAHDWRKRQEELDEERKRRTPHSFGDRPPRRPAR